MLARRYETRLDEDGLITFEKVWSKRINVQVAKNELRHPEHIYELSKALRLDNYSEEHVFLLIFDTKMHLKSFIEIGIGEIGEIHSIYQKMYQGHAFEVDHVKKEFGDLLWFIAEYCTAKGWSLDDIMRMNIDKLKERYPEGFEEDKSLHRAEGDI